MKTIEKAIADLRDQVNIQCSNGNWNYDPYMHGLANGLILALATLEDKEPKYLNPPEQWAIELPAPGAMDAVENKPDCLNGLHDFRNGACCIYCGAV